jgi:hypothetical protein
MTLPPDPDRRQFLVRPMTMRQLDDWVHSLIDSDWNDPDGPIRLNADIPPAEVMQVPFLRWTRGFLRHLHEDGGAALTESGWLKRKYVARMVELIQWPASTTDMLRKPYIKVINEYDVKELNVVRDVCEVARLVSHRKGMVRTARAALPLLADEQAGRLYHRLFHTFFRELDLYECVYSDAAAPFFEDTMAVTLWRLSLITADWRLESDLPGLTLLRPARQAAREPDLPDMETYALRGLVLVPLVWFGLLEQDPADTICWREPDAVRYRKTPLFDRFLRFHLSVLARLAPESARYN